MSQESTGIRWLLSGTNFLLTSKEKQAGKLRKNIQISFPRAREGGRTVGSGRFATIIE